MTTLDTVGRVRIDLTDTTDPDHDRYHGRGGTIGSIRIDDAAREFGRGIASIEILVRIGELDEGMGFRTRDVRPRG